MGALKIHQNNKQTLKFIVITNWAQVIGYEKNYENNLTFRNF